jgi:type III secretion system YscQ/HrcQ family protein
VTEAILRRPRLARIPAGQMQALSILARHGADQHAMLPAQGSADMSATTWRFSLEPCAPAAQGEGPGRMVWFDWMGTSLSLRLPAHACNAWLAARLPDLDIGELPEEFLDAALEALARDILAVLGRGDLFAGIKVVPARPANALDACVHIWRLTLLEPHTMRTVVAHLAADDAALQALADAFRRWPVRRAQPCPDHIPIAMRARAGVAEIPAMMLRTLSRGDIVLFDHNLVAPDGGVWLTTPDGQGLGVRPCHGRGLSRYAVTQEWSLLVMDDTLNDTFGDDDADAGRYAGVPSKEIVAADAAWDAGGRGEEESLTSPDSMANTQGGDTAGRLDVDRLTIRLSFDLGEQMLTLGELRRLRPGEIFDLQRRLDAGPVHVRANGTLVGTAELVDIDGRVGARIHTLDLDRPAPCR